MKKNTYIIGGAVLSLIIIAIITLQSTGALSVVSVGGVNYDCSSYYDSPTTSLSTYEQAAELCEADGYDCFTGVTGPFNRPYFYCQAICYACDYDQQSVITATADRFNGCESLEWDGETFFEIDDADARAFTSGSFDENDLYDKYCAPLQLCYFCNPDTGKVDTWQQKDCPSWTTTTALTDAECEEALKPEPVTCWVCDDDVLIEREYDNNCPVGWSDSLITCYTPPVDEPTLVSCYKCEDGDLNKEFFLGECEAGWSENKPECEIETTFCYACENNKIVSDDFNAASCPSGWSTEPLDGCGFAPEEIICYSCSPEGETLTSITYQDCPEGTSTVRPNCVTQSIDCYRCINGDSQTTSYPGTTCPSGWAAYDDESEVKCGGFQWVGEVIDFENKPVGSVFLLLAIGFLLYAIVVTVKDAVQADIEGF